MKRLTHYQACIVLLASMGISVGPLLHAASAAEKNSSLPVKPVQSVQSVQIAQSGLSPSDEALSRGIEFVQQGDLKAAIAAFEEAVALDATSAAAHYNLGAALRQDNQLQPAATAFWPGNAGRSYVRASLR